ncbi:tyrosine-type recombinase/integrase [Acinetobacter sp. UBA3106]|uniref:tyrosine-type recombinase/integrase n=1 Tax=Acinetobacter sp. UBA3106 TaxID=1945936 RepID=UPI0025C4D7DE|nr:tyrosine-type recombinase/integrase [Acinetobacter sp. UBA3106]
MKRDDVNKFPMKDTTLSALEFEEKEYRLNNGDNLYFVVNPKGNKRWELRYKKPSTGKWSFLGLGAYPEVGSKWARQKADEARKLISQGIDPVVQKAEERLATLEQGAYTFKQLAEEFYLTKTWTPDTTARNVGALNNHVMPAMGKRDYRNITKQEWHDLFQEIQKKLNPRTGKPIIETGQRVTALVREIYDYAEVIGKATYNPITNLHKYLKKHESNGMKHVSDEELPALLRAIDKYPASDTRIGLKLLSILFSRPSELREAKWEEFDLAKGIWLIPASRMKMKKEHKVPLATQALSLLQELKQLTSHSPFLFPSRSNKGQPKSDTIFIEALKRMGYGGKQNPHGFRHIASTTLNNQFSDKPQVVEACLAHTKNGVKGTYDKATHFEERKTMMQWYADHLEKLADDSVIHFKRA